MLAAAVVLTATIVFSIAGWTQPAMAQGALPPGAPSVTVHVVAPAVVASPGDIVTHVFRFANNRAAPVRVDLEVEMPPGWFNLGFPSHLNVEPLSSEDVFLTVIVPPHAQGDNVLRVAAVVDGYVVDAAEAIVSVRGVSGVDVRAVGGGDRRGLSATGMPGTGNAGAPESDDRHIYAGMELVQPYAIGNNGNVPDTYIVRATSQRGWPVVVEPPEVTVEPGESVVVDVRVTVPKSARGADSLLVKAVSVTDPDVAAEAWTLLRVVGQMAEREPLVATLAARSVVSFDVTSQTGRAALLIGGPLGLPGEDVPSIEALLEVPVPHVTGDGPALSRLVFERKNMRLSLGEVAVREGIAARLEGYGVDVSRRGDGLLWGVTAVDGRRYAVRAAFDAGPVCLLTFLRMQPAGGDGAQVQAPTTTPETLLAVGSRVRGTWARGEWALEGEAAGRIDGGSDGTGLRLRGDAIAGSHRLSLTAESWAADVKDAEASSRLSAAWLTRADWLGNVGLHVSLSTPTPRFVGQERVWEERLYVGRSFGSALFAYGQQYARTRVGAGDDDTTERGVAVGGRLSPLAQWPDLQVRLHLSSARQQPVQSGRIIEQTRAQIGLTLPVGAGTLSTSADYRHVTGAAEGQRIGLSAAFRAPIFSRSFVDVRARYRWDGLTGERSTFEWVRYEHQLTDHIKLTATVRHRATGPHASWAFVVGGTVDFRLPILLAVKGSVQGRIDPGDTGVDVQRFVVRAGELTAPVQSDGTFVFPALAPGMHVLQVEGLPARVATVPGKIAVEVEAGKTTELHIGLHTLSGIEVRLGRGESAGSVLSGRPTSLEGVRVELFDGQHLVRVGHTRRDGTLPFPDLPAGTYRLRLDTSTLPEGVLVAEAQRTVTVAEGAWHAVQWMVEEAPVVIEFRSIKPTAAFTYAPAAPEAGYPITFRDSSTVDVSRRIVSWAWDFGDGALAQGPDVVHVFGESGRYPVSLTVIDDAGDADTVTVIVDVE